MIYKWIVREDPSHCPGGVCEVRQKEPIQKFNPIQATIAAITTVALVVGTYLFLAKTREQGQVTTTTKYLPTFKLESCHSHSSSVGISPLK